MSKKFKCFFFYAFLEILFWRIFGIFITIFDDVGIFILAMQRNFFSSVSRDATKICESFFLTLITKNFLNYMKETVYSRVNETIFLCSISSNSERKNWSDW